MKSEFSNALTSISVVEILFSPDSLMTLLEGGIPDIEVHLNGTIERQVSYSVETLDLANIPNYMSEGECCIYLAVHNGKGSKDDTLLD